jgi:hypothetical protein
MLNADRYAFAYVPTENSAAGADQSDGQGNLVTVVINCDIAGRKPHDRSPPMLLEKLQVPSQPKVEAA